MLTLRSAIGVLFFCPLTLQFAAAQAFQDLSTTAEGSVLYFSSPVRQKGTDQQFYSKIFRWTAAGGVQVFAEVRDPASSTGCAPPDFYQLRTPQVSADGAVLAYTASRPVANSRYCPREEPNQGVIVQSGQTIRLDGNVALSPNGRYAVTTTTAALANEFHTVTNLASGMSTIVAGAFNGSSRRVTNEGTILTSEPSAVILTDRTGQTRVLPTKWPVSDAIIDPAGATVVYLTPFAPDSPARLSAINVQTGTETAVVTGFALRNPLLTADGSTLFFIDQAGPAPQLFAIAMGGGSPRQITNIPDGIAAAVVSGNGLVAFAVTRASRLLRLDVPSGSSTELVASTPLITAAYRVYPPPVAIAPIGSLIDLYGSGLGAERQATLCGRPLVLLHGRVRFQVPWDLPEGPCQAIVSSDSPFEHGISLEVRQFDPQFIYEDNAPALLIHGSFNRVVSERDPAHPGEAIIAYMTGLGPVDPNNLVSAGFQCRFDGTPADVLYAGLAPQFPGFYQVNVRVPALASVNPSLICGWDATRQAATPVWVGP